jgi:hypothetical protein
MGFARKFANRAFTETVEIPEAHGNGHGDGHGAVEANGHGEVEGGEHAAIGGTNEEH